LLLVLATVASPAIARGGGHGHGNHGHHNDRSWHDHGRWYGHRAYGYSSSYPVYRSSHRSYPVYRSGYPVYRSAVYGSGYPVYGYPPGAGYYVPAPVWTRGARYYDPGYGPTYVVTDYGAYGLGYPPSGYGWRHDGHGDFLLVWLATGVIVDYVLHGGY
jgi:Ni/Co efflux regulator RcnB